MLLKIIGCQTKKHWHSHSNKQCPGILIVYKTEMSSNTAIEFVLELVVKQFVQIIIMKIKKIIIIFPTHTYILLRNRMRYFIGVPIYKYLFL